MMSRFPKITETFILYEILELERMGVQVEIFPIIRERESAMHAEAAALVERAHYQKALSSRVLLAQFGWLSRRPGAYLRTWWNVVRGNLRSPKFLSRALLVMPQAAYFARQMQQLGIQHIHAHYATHPALAAYIIHQLTGIPYSITAHAHDIYVDRTMLGEKLEAARFIVTISDYNRQLLTSLYGEAIGGKIHVIHCGVDSSVFQPRRAPQPQAELNIICVASLEEYKGHPYLIEACAQLKAQGIPFRCLFVGDGEDRPQLEALVASRGLSEQVVFMGRQPRQRVSELLNEANVMVLPSITARSGKKEGIPVALMEALAVEMPVIASRISGIPELIEHEVTGLLVPEKDSRAIADALLRVYNDPAFALSLGKRGREKALREFDLQANTRELCARFLSLTQEAATIR